VHEEVLMAVGALANSTCLRKPHETYFWDGNGEGEGVVVVKNQQFVLSAN